MADITATTPVVVPATEGVTYDKWFLTSLIIKADPARSPTVVSLRRAATVDGQTVLMDGRQGGVSFNLDLWKEIADTPEIAAALDAVLVAVTAFARKKNLL